MEKLALSDVYTVVEEFKKICSDCFLSGSYRFGRANAESDIDIVFPIMAKQDVEIYIAKYRDVQPSHYNAGIKFTKMMGDRAQSVNAIFLHQLDFVCWFKAANMINAANVDIKAMTRPEFHALHQIMVSLPKMMIKDCVNCDNYRDYLK
jgi:hypothetical protein